MLVRSVKAESSVRGGAAQRKERRAAPRTKVQKLVQIRPNDARDKSVDGVLLDLSACGIGLRLNKPLAPGKTFVLVLPDTKERAAPLNYRVVRCTPKGHGEFHIGAAFFRNQ
jgi:hypothetical protein